MLILFASGVLVLLAVLVRVLGRHDHVLVTAARGVLWIAVLFALIAMFLAFETPAHAGQAGRAAQRINQQGAR